MSYVTYDQIVRFWGESTLVALADLDRDGAIDTELVEDAIARASGLIDSYISSRYALPLSQPPVVLQQPCADIAVYMIANEHGRATEMMRDRYRDAISWLKDVAASKAHIVEIGSETGENITAGAALGSINWRFPKRF